MSLNYKQLFPTLHQIQAQGLIKQSPQDFKVTEIIDIDFSGEGEHLYLYIEKISTNTDWLAIELAKICQISARDVSYAGMKDRHAVTRQWFSLQLPKQRDLKVISENLPKGCTLLDSNWHSKKLKRGQLKSNHFELLIHGVTGSKESIESNIESIKQNGAPNYFGSQRFGIDMNNIVKAEAFFANPKKRITRTKRSLLISSARSLIFNTIVAERIKAKNWNRSLQGDILQLDGTNSWFDSKDADNNEIMKRLESFDIHLTAALWGDYDQEANSDRAQLELECANQYPDLKKGLENIRMNSDRRSIRVVPINISYTWNDATTLKLEFSLAKGCYATSIMREILNTQDESKRAN